jgi:hypothetical protein
MKRPSYLAILIDLMDLEHGKKQLSLAEKFIQ